MTLKMSSVQQTLLERLLSFFKSDLHYANLQHIDNKAKSTLHQRSRKLDDYCGNMSMIIWYDMSYAQWDAEDE